ncbi:MAG: sn-glycerol-3-phosphate ABC transporter ATP-binding protein UgpC [Ilumatobacteraceae bacterium]
MAQITLTNVDKVYENGYVGIRNLNLEIHDGEFLVLVGPSGCGKSTALRMLAGLEGITRGTMKIDDQVMNHVPPKDRDIAMVFQSYALYPHLTVRENIGFSMKLAKVSKAEMDRRVNDAAARLNLTEWLDRRPGQLSGGQRQRVAMGRAIVRKPKAFLMDEPLSNLDAKLRVQMRAEIAKLQRDLNVTTVYVTHDQIEAMTMGDRVAVLSRGVLQQVDTPQRLYDHPNSIFVASFIGSPQMNLFAGSIRLGDTPTVSIGSQAIPLAASVLDARPALRSYEGKEVAVGVRPEYCKVTNRTNPLAIQGTVEVRESLGSEVMLHLSVSAVGLEVTSDGVSAKEPAWLISRNEARTAAEVGDAVAVTADPAEMHFFDRESGAAISA